MQVGSVRGADGRVQAVVRVDERGFAPFGDLNPRYLTRVKNYRTFFSFGPVLMTVDEARARR